MACFSNRLTAVDRLCLCTEFAPAGNLYDFLHSHSTLSENYDYTILKRWSIEIAQGEQLVGPCRTRYQLFVRGDHGGWGFYSVCIFIFIVGMAYLGRKKITHADLKSPNVLLSDGTVIGGTMRAKKYSAGDLDINDIVCKICDFGLAQRVDEVSRNEKGTFRWMSPEVYRTPGAVTAKSMQFLKGKEEESVR